MSYEDRSDLAAPSEVVSSDLLARLQLRGDAASLIEEAADNPQCVSVTSAAQEAIAVRVAEDTAPERGAPPGASAVETDAMLSGYRFGRLALGPLMSRAQIASSELRDRTEAMYLYDLHVWKDGTVPIERNGLARDGALEEAVSWAWAFGLGVAVVEADASTIL